MPNWKKVIVSGSNVSQLNNDGVYLKTIGGGILSSSAQIATDISGAFTGAGFVDTTGTPSNTQIAFFSDANTIQGSSNLTISGSGTPTRILTLDGVFHSTGSVGLNGFTSISGSSSNSSSRIGITAAADEGLLFSSNTSEVKSAIRLSTFYTDGYSIGRFISPGATNTLRIGPDVILLGNLSVTGSLSISGSTLISSSAQISSVASASFASSGHNFTATGTSEIDALQLGSLTTNIASFISATSSFVPNNSTNFTIFTLSALSNEALFIDYVIHDSAKNNKRAGNLRFTWNTTDTVFDETSTTSIGNTNNFTFSTNNNGTNLNVLVNNTTGQGMSIIFEYKILYIQ